MTNPTDAEMMPDRIWAFEDYDGGIPRAGYWIDEKSECPKSAVEYVRALPLPATARTYEDGVMDGVNCMIDHLPDDIYLMRTMRGAKSRKLIDMAKAVRAQFPKKPATPEQIAAILALIAKEPDNG